MFYTSEDGKTAYYQKDGFEPKEIHVSKRSQEDIPSEKDPGVKSPLNVIIGYNEVHLEHLAGKKIVTEQGPGQYRTCKIADGTYDVSGINKGAKGGYNSWDIAGPHAVLIAAGGDFVTMDKKPLIYSHNYRIPDHIVGGVKTLESLELLDKQHAIENFDFSATDVGSHPMFPEEAIEILRPLRHYISFDTVGGESRTYVKVPVAYGQDYANRVANALIALGAITQEVYSVNGSDAEEHYPVKGKGGADKVKQALINGGVNFPGSGLSADQVRESSL